MTFFKDTRGSFTLEASLIFPIIFVLIIMFLFVSILIYQKVTLHYVASLAADRTAYTWDNSFKQPFEGEFNISERDDLYWRLTDDRLLSSMFGLTMRGESNVTLEKDREYTGLSERKLYRIVPYLPNDLEGTMTFQNGTTSRSIRVEIESPLRMPQFITHIFGETLKAFGQSIIVDPVEYNRNVQMMWDYYDKWPKDTNINKILERQSQKEGS
ncbi:TadE/TadG family type IV pilus assembly protein [Caldalkalibacillus salinus]|uniref:TadE/TadG family type IV pilus assembly protein n=1 Tax=Caldalkalibacillus salinus TaxID=2803787 RepID=UPI001922006C|nr:TadE/TadG family type IV pilus assembly protein [Caldalkalibacillus salinus]